ncbi:MAG TPA: YqeG family HAD IIIA-type phosphatase [bacterium]|nr:YqeG family HAD IIIA-type phosphatase [bacterium]
MILRLLTPSRAAASVEEIDPADLVRAGVRGVILDLDNTIVAWGVPGPTAAVRAWVARLLAGGLRVCIVSNNSRIWAAQTGDVLGVPVVGWALKPIPFGFRRAMAIMGTTPRQTALVGDQLFTDVLGGNLLGLRTILVEPLSVREFPTTRLLRRLERLLRDRVVRSTSRPFRR